MGALHPWRCPDRYDAYFFEKEVSRKAAIPSGKPGYEPGGWAFFLGSERIKEPFRRSRTLFGLARTGPRASQIGLFLLLASVVYYGYPRPVHRWEIIYSFPTSVLFSSPIAGKEFILSQATSLPRSRSIAARLFNRYLNACAPGPPYSGWFPPHPRIGDRPAACYSKIAQLR